jgi:MFS family permease
MNWECFPKAKIALLISIMFIGAAVGGLALSSLPDRIGRKKTLMIIGSLHLGAQFGLLYGNDYTTRMICFGLLGFFFVKNSSVYNWMFELTEEKYKPISCGVMGMWDCSNGLILGLYFIFVKPSAEPMLTALTFLGLICFSLQILLIPESPKFLLINGRK